MPPVNHRVGEIAANGVYFNYSAESIKEKKSNGHRGRASMAFKGEQGEKAVGDNSVLQDDYLSCPYYSIYVSDRFLTFIFSFILLAHWYLLKEM